MTDDVVFVVVVAVVGFLFVVVVGTEVDVLLLSPPCSFSSLFHVLLGQEVGMYMAGSKSSFIIIAPS